MTRISLMLTCLVGFIFGSPAPPPSIKDIWAQKAPDSSMFEAGQLVRWKQESWDNPGMKPGSKRHDIYDAAYIPSIGRQFWLLKDEKGWIYPDKDGYRQVRINPDSIEPVNPN